MLIKTIKQAYSLIYNHCPVFIRKRLNYAAQVILQKPTINPIDRTGFSGRRPLVVISADFEMGWAWRYARQVNNPMQLALDMGKRERAQIPHIVKQLDIYGIPITWATVGHLMLESCKNGDHEHLPKLPYFENRNWRFSKGNWFDCDPYSDFKKDNIWYAPDLVELILNSKVQHEIGCHTFSHIDFSDKNCPQEVAEGELSACIDAAKKWGLTLKSFVFPGGTFGNINSLRKFGFEVYRKQDVYDMAYPHCDNLGIVVTNSTLGLDKSDFNWKQREYLKRYQNILNKAIKYNSSCHFWFHPSMDPLYLDEIFPQFLNLLARYREKGLIDIVTMGALAQKILKND